MLLGHTPAPCCASAGREYNAIAHRFGKPSCTLPRRPATSALPWLAAERYGDRLVADLERIDPPVLITLGAEVWDTLQLLQQLDARRRRAPSTTCTASGASETA